MFGSRAVAYLPRELRQGAEQPSIRQCIYLGMADEVGNGQRLIEYYTNDKGIAVLMGQVFEWKTGDVTNFPGESPMRRSVGPRATAEQLDADMELLEPAWAIGCLCGEGDTAVQDSGRSRMVYGALGGVCKKGMQPGNQLSTLLSGEQMP